MINCTCNDEIHWFTCPIHGLSRPPKALDAKIEFEKCMNFDYWYNKYYIPLNQELCFDCEDHLH